MCWGKKQILRSKGSKERTDGDSLLATQVHSDVWAWAASKDRDVGCGPDTSVGVSLDVCGSCYL